ncbi:hypothetical protein CGH45_24035 [Vibrio parahaemolyticus]|nr:hypothetical protein CGH45_24035 [Vibrio parahaemolyticus]
MIAGSGSCEVRLRKIANSMKGVTFLTGMSQSQLATVYNSINYLVFPSKRTSESLGLIPIEAMMCGVPVLSSTIGATGDYIVGDMCKLSFEPGDVKGLEVALNKANAITGEEYLLLSQLAISIATKYSSSEVIDDLHRVFETSFNRKESK